MTTPRGILSGYISRECTSFIRAQSQQWYKPLAARQYASTNGSRPLRVGIVGSGPAGFYAATRILEKNDDAIVDLYEQLPTPFGLVRYGVAPDHPEVKDRFEEVAKSPRFNFIGNVKVGHDIPLKVMKRHYDALLFAYGASHDRALGVPGEDLNGIVSARAFVGWYNGLPEYDGLNPDLQSDDTAHVIGNGNVALDVARILLSDLDRLRTTDITEQTIEALSKSKIKRIQIYGRRGPMQAAFTIKEVRELLTLPNVGFTPIESALLPQTDWISKLPRLEQRKYRLASLLGKGAPLLPEDSPKSWTLRSLLSPVEFRSDGASRDISTMILRRNEYADDSTRFSPAARVRSTEESISQPARIIFRSIGYKSTPLLGLAEDLGVPFDVRSGRIPNDMHGRVVNPGEGPTSLTAEHVDGIYCAGWVKNGPTGVIASTMEDAFASADILLKDWEDGVKFLGGGTKADPGSTGLGWDGVLREDELTTEHHQLRPVSWSDWLKIDKVEKERGHETGKPREKIQTIDGMLRILD